MFLLKLIAAAFAALYGFYATVTDFRVERNGQKVLSTKGYIGLALLVLSTAVSLSYDVSREKREDKAAAIAQQALKDLSNRAAKAGDKLETTSEELREQLKQSRGISTKLDTAGRSIEKNVATSAAILSETHRALDPIEGHLRMVTQLSIDPQQPLVQPYLQRLKIQAAKEEQGSLEAYAKGADFPSAGIPEEEKLAELADIKESVTFKRLGDRERGLTLKVDCATSSHGGTGYETIKYEWWTAMGGLKRSSLTLTCATYAQEVRTNRIRSYRDFDGAEVNVEVQGPTDYKDHPYEQGLPIKFGIDSILIQSPTSRTCGIRDPQEYVPFHQPGDFLEPYASISFRTSLRYNCWYLGD